MRSRASLAASLCVAALGVAPAAALAAPHHVSLNVAPNHINTGDPLLIWGRLTGANHGARAVVLYHRIAGQKRFTVVQRGKTDANGYYSFVRKQGVVTTNRAWFARALNGHSRKVRAHVAANLS